MPTFLIFAGQTYYPNGGSDDLLGVCEGGQEPVAGFISQTFREKANWREDMTQVYWIQVLRLDYNLTMRPTRYKMYVRAVDSRDLTEQEKKLIVFQETFEQFHFYLIRQKMSTDAANIEGNR